jgi:hypothetical protein
MRSFSSLSGRVASTEATVIERCPSAHRGDPCNARPTERSRRDSASRRVVTTSSAAPIQTANGILPLRVAALRSQHTVSLFRVRPLHRIRCIQHGTSRKTAGRASARQASDRSHATRARVAEKAGGA